jgi:PAS domain S-box-containing protein
MSKRDKAVVSPQNRKDDQQEIYRNLFEQAADGIFVSDPSGRYLDVNPRGCEMLGFTREEILSKTIRDLVTPDDLAATPLKLDQLRAGKTVISERNLICKDGSLLPVEISGRMLSDGRLLGITRDISKRKQAQQMLTESQERYRSLFHSMAEGLAYCKMIFENGQPVDWVYLEVNEAFPELTGLKDITGKRVTEAIPGIRETDPELFEIYGRVAQTGIPEKFEIYLESLEMWFSVSAFSPQPEYFVAVFEVITERKRMENALRSSEEKFRRLADYTNGWEYWVGADGKHIYASPACERITGYSPEEFQQDPTLLQKITHPEDKHVIEHHFSDALEDTHTVGLDFRIIHKDGRERWINHICMPIYGDHGEWLGRRASNRDVTERVRAEQALKESEARYRYLFENNPHPMWVYDLETLAFLAVNDAAIAKYGYSREEFLSMTIRDIRPEEDLPRLMENLAQPRLPIQHSSGWRHRLKDGTVIDVEISSHTIDLEGRFSALVVAQDVTERIKAESRVRYLTRLYATLSQVNQAIVRIQSREDLFQSICEVAVRFGEFHMAWIGLLNLETGAVEPAAHAGYGRDYLDSIAINIKEGSYSQGPTGMAIRSGTVEFSDDISRDKRMKPWREEALKRGFHSSAAVPIRQGGEIIGTLNLYARETGFFSEEERGLLEEIGLDISFALDRLVSEAERKLAEDALRASEKRYRQLFENNQVGVFYTSLDGRILGCNDKFAQVFGYSTSEEIRQRSALDLYFDVKTRKAYLEELSKTGSLTNYELLLKRKDGSPVWILENVTIAVDENGQRSQVHGTLIDITERKLAEGALRENEQKFQALAETMTALYETTRDLVSERDLTRLFHTIVERASRLLNTTGGGLYLADPQTRRVRCMVSYNTLHDYTGIELNYGEGAAGLVAQTEEPLIINDYSQWPGRAKVYENEKPFRAVLSVPMKWQDELIGVIHMLDYGGVREFTEADKDLMLLFANQAAIAAKNASLYTLAQEELLEHKLAEEALRVSEQKFETVANFTADWEYWVSPEGKHIWVSPSCEQLTGYRPKEFMDDPDLFPHIIHEQDREAFSAHINRKDVSISNPVDLRILRRDGTIRWINHICHRVYDEDGTWLGVRASNRDITDRKQAELLQEVVYQIAQTAQYSESLEELVPQIHRVIGNIMSAGNFYIALYDETNNLINFPYSVDEMDPPTSGSHSFGKGLTEYVLRTGESLLCTQSIHDELEAAGEIDLVGAPAPIWLGVPLKVDSKTIGVMAVQHYSDPDAFGEREQRILEFVSSQVAIALSRKQAETALRESQARFATVFRSSPMAIAITRLKDNSFVDVNIAWLNLTGFSRDETVGHTPLELDVWVHPEERSHLVSILNKKGTVKEFEFRMKKKSGEISDMLISAELIVLSGEACMLSMALDISERKRSEEKIRQQVNRLTALNTIDRAIASSFDLGMTLSMLVSNISQQLNVSAASVMLYNPNSLMLDYAASHGFRGNEITRSSIHLGEGHAGKIALERRMAHVQDLSQADPSFPRYITENEDFVAYYGLPLIAKGEIKGVLEVYNRQPFDPESDWLAFLETMAEQAAIAIDNMQLFEGLQRSNLELSLAYDATIEGWSYALDLRDKETEGHTQRVTEKTVELARAFGLGNHELVHIRRGALLHDIGKMGVPDSILLKPSALTTEEWVVMKMHPTFARQMLERIQYLKPALDIPYCHHERWDGSGYPRGLSGRQIPLAARIFAAVDVWDALMSDRPYRPAWPRSEVIRHLRAGSGSHFDPEVVEMFLDLEPAWNKSA